MEQSITTVTPIQTPTPPMAVPECWLVVRTIPSASGTYPLATALAFEVTPDRDAETALRFAREHAAKHPGAVILHYAGPR